MLLDDTLRDLLKRTHTIAIVGAKDKPGSPVDNVGRYLMSAGYTVVPIHPVRKAVWGLPTLTSIEELPLHDIKADIICLFRASEYCAAHASETLALPVRPLIFWMQEGIWSPEAGNMLAPEGIRVVEDLCLKTEHKRLFPIQEAADAPQEAPDISALFACQRCGHCCHGRGGIIVGPEDLPRLCAHFGLPEQEFLARHTRLQNGKPVMDTQENGYCKFYNEGCAIHPARPNVCRAWPFFRGNLVDDASFAMAKEDCRGIRATASHQDFATQGYKWLEAAHLLATDPTVEGRALIVSQDEIPHFAEGDESA